MSGKRDREARREERLQAEESAEASERRQRMVKLASALAFLALVVVAILIVVSQSGSGDGGDASSIEGAAEIEAELEGIPQKGLVLGAGGARATLVEFGDLQCPVCKGFAEEILPPVIEGKVRNGEARIEFRNFTIISQQSVPAGAAAIAAGKQGRGWYFLELFYRNQGREASGYVTDEFLTAIARAAGVPNIAQWNKDRQSKSVLREVSQTTAEAQRLGFNGTPSFAVEGPASEGLETLGTPSSSGELEAALEKAAG
ncbi:MAG TPA: thioredoxin domain-containing protein [Solirubrobacterales bacterium]|nr:thioredoxin domain-containing protein [Solirubrobacterales bacterium]